MTSASRNLTEQELFEAACGGDEEAFRCLVGPHRAALHAHCRRMLGSVDDGEDALQDALLRAWRGLCRFERRSSLRTWLYRIATNASLDALARRPERAFSIDHGRPAGIDGHEGARHVIGPLLTEPHRGETPCSTNEYAAPAARVEQRETAELAVVAALRRLPPRQCAVLILREALGFSADEVAQALGMTVAAVNSALQRARTALAERPAASSQHTRLRSGDHRFRELARNVVDAFERGDVAAIVSLLADDARSALPAYASRPRRPRGDDRFVGRARSAATSPCG